MVNGCFRNFLRATAAALACVGAALCPAPARAVQQPDGKVIPVILSPTGACTSGLNVQACLDDSEVSLGGMAGKVGAVASATINQETFDPSCQLTFKVLSKGGSFYGHAFGWYRVRDGNVPPALADLNVFLTCADAQAPGTTKTLTLPPGVGKIGFFMASYSGGCGALAPNGTLTTEPLYTFYTERRFNGLDRAGKPIANLVLNVVRVLTWQSAAEPGSFYFGWEDDGRTADDNFNDLVTRVSGISCSGGGASCDTGGKGACGAGTMQCRGGMLTCVPEQGPVPERCNAVDDNCDGTVDEGDHLCPPTQVCQRGTCVPACTESEFYRCAPGFECDPNGLCVESACKNVTCPVGQLCRGGHCRGECEGIVCPYGQACRHGGCVDVCATLTCDDGFRCLVKYPNGATDAVGVCANCPCGGCPGGTTCTAGACVPSDCAAVTCAAGMHCQAGACVDNCAGAMCPSGSACSAGQCAPGRGGAGGPPGMGPGGVTPVMTPADGGADAAPGAIEPGTIGTKGGCTCDVPSGGASGEIAAALLMLALAISARRARRSR